MSAANCVTHHDACDCREAAHRADRDALAAARVELKAQAERIRQLVARSRKSADDEESAAW